MLCLKKKSYFPGIAQLELKLGLGGTSYEDFIRNMHLPPQLRYSQNALYFMLLEGTLGFDFRRKNIRQDKTKE